jgi:Arc/MetJ-type ribon-helix-helix transcriptional regulator
MGKRSSYRVNLKLKPGRDQDLIDWIESQSYGKRSEAIRDALRYGIGLKKPERTVIAETVREAVSEALKGLKVVAAQQGVTLDTNEVEEAFGAQLDQLLDQFK